MRGITSLAWIALLLAGCAKSHRVYGEPVWLAHCNGSPCGPSDCTDGSCAPAQPAQVDAGLPYRRTARPSDASVPVRAARSVDAGPRASAGARDGCVPWADSGCGAPDLGPLLQAVAASDASWRGLTDGSAPYWYEELNCTHSGARKATMVQVENDVPRIVGKRVLNGSGECGAWWANRYASFTPHTMGELVAECEDLVRHEGLRVLVIRDPRGVLASCVWPGPRDCADACGEGFVLGRWAFGHAPGTQPANDASARRGDGGAH